MKKIAIALGLLSLIALPARSELFFVQLSTSTSYAVVNATATKNGGPFSEPVKFYSLQVKGSTGTVTAWDVRLEASIDGLYFSPVVTHQTTDGNGTVKTSTIAAAGFPATYMRIRTATIDTSTIKTLVIDAIGSQ